MKLELRVFHDREFLLFLPETDVESRALDQLGGDGDKVEIIVKTDDHFHNYLRCEIIPTPVAKGIEKSQCRSCVRDIFWLTAEPSEKNPSPKSNPIDAFPARDGNILILENGHYVILTGDVLKQAQAAFGHARPLFKSHFVTCPDAQSFRRAR